MIDCLRCFNPRRRRPRMGSQRPSAERDNLSFSSARESKPQRHFIPRRRSAPPISPPSLLGSLPSYHPDLERPLPRPSSPASPASILEQPLARPPFGHFRDVCPSSVPRCGRRSVSLSLFFEVLPPFQTPLLRRLSVSPSMHERALLILCCLSVLGRSLARSIVPGS